MSRGYGSTSFGSSNNDLIQTRNNISVSTLQSWSIWVYSDSGGTSFKNIFNMFDARTDSGNTAIIYHTAAPILYTRNFSTTIGYWGFSKPANNGWHHLALTFNGSSTANVPTAYIDGVSQTITTVQTPVGSVTSFSFPIAIGGENTSAGNGWSGMLAYASFWSGVILNQSEIFLLANGYNPLLIRPEYLGMYMPLDGINNKEPDFVNGLSGTISGTKKGTSEPPVIDIAQFGLGFGQINNFGIPIFAAGGAVPAPPTNDPYIRGLVMLKRGATIQSGLSPLINKGLVMDELNTITRV